MHTVWHRNRIVLGDQTIGERSTTPSPIARCSRRSKNFTCIPFDLWDKFQQNSGIFCGQTHNPTGIGFKRPQVFETYMYTVAYNRAIKLCMVTKLSKGKLLIVSIRLLIPRPGLRQPINLCPSPCRVYIPFDLELPNSMW